MDFVIESNTEKPSIDLPNRSNEASPIKPNNPSPSAPGKLKLRWLKASKCDQPSKVSKAWVDSQYSVFNYHMHDYFQDPTHTML